MTATVTLDILHTVDKLYVNLSGFVANFNLVQQNVSFSVQLSFGEEGNIRPGEQASSGEKTLIVCWLCRLDCE